MKNYIQAAVLSLALTSSCIAGPEEKTFVQISGNGKQYAVHALMTESSSRTVLDLHHYDCMTCYKNGLKRGIVELVDLGSDGEVDFVYTADRKIGLGNGGFRSKMSEKEKDAIDGHYNLVKDGIKRK